MKALVTGASGFVGRYIVERLLAEGAGVRVLVRKHVPELSKLGCSVAQGDLRDKAAVNLACNGIDTVFHAASRVGLWGPWSDFHEVNVVGTKNLLEAAKTTGVKRFIYTSSPSVVNGTNTLTHANESVPYPARYLSHYPATKALAERIVISENNQGGMLTASLRPHLVWGPRDSHLVPQMIERARRGRLCVIGRGDNLVDFTYVENVAQAHVLAARALVPDSPVAGSCYFIGQNEPVPLWEFVRRVLESVDLKLPAKRIPYGVAYALGALCEAAYSVLPLSGEPRITRFLAGQLAKSHYFDITRARNDFGYVPEVSMEEGFARLAEFNNKASGSSSIMQSLQML